MATPLVTIGFSFDDELENMHLNAVRKALVKRSEDGRRSGYNNFGLDTIAARPIQIDDVRLPLGHRA
jgi:hypothetical protein